MIRSTEVYANTQMQSMCRKIERLNGLGVQYEVGTAKSFDGDYVVLLSWDEREYETALEAEEWP